MKQEEAVAVVEVVVLGGDVCQLMTHMSATKARKKKKTQLRFGSCDVHAHTSLQAPAKKSSY